MSSLLTTKASDTTIYDTPINFCTYFIINTRLISVFFVFFVDDDHSLLIVSLISSEWFTLRLVSSEKPFEDMKGCSVFIDVTVGVFFYFG